MVDGVSGNAGTLDTGFDYMRCEVSEWYVLERAPKVAKGRPGAGGEIDI
jgi:hypothetical protein